MLLLSKFKISGHSMTPTIKNGDTVLVSCIFYLFINPKINDIVAFKDKNGQVLIKRIIGIQNNKYYLYGDNKQDSYDSRSFGFIMRSQILGKMFLRL
jgi:nickel-type superoxide dismutase maturation protease